MVSLDVRGLNVLWNVDAIADQLSNLSVMMETT